MATPVEAGADFTENGQPDCSIMIIAEDRLLPVALRGHMVEAADKF
jgi:hypothetical protein